MDLDVGGEHGSDAVLGDGILVGAADVDDPVGAARVGELLYVFGELSCCLVVAEGSTKLYMGEPVQPQNKNKINNITYKNDNDFVFLCLLVTQRELVLLYAQTLK